MLILILIHLQVCPHVHNIHGCACGEYDEAINFVRERFSALLEDEFILSGCERATPSMPV